MAIGIIAVGPLLAAGMTATIPIIAIINIGCAFSIDYATGIFISNVQNTIYRKRGIR